MAKRAVRVVKRSEIESSLDQSVTDPKLFRFFQEYLKKADSPEIYDLLVSVGKSTKCTAPIAAVADIKYLEMQEKRKLLRGCPIKEEGEWLTEKEILELGTGCSKELLRSLFKEKASYFPGRKIKKLGKPVSQYWVGSENFGLLEKKGRTPTGWSWKLQAYQEAKSTYEHLFDSLKGLEKICQTTYAPPQLPEVIAPATSLPQASAPIAPLPASTPVSPIVPVAAPPVVRPEPTGEGMRLTAPEIKKYGSALNESYIGQILRKKPEIFFTKRREAQGKPHEGFVTRENYARLGLTYYPGDPKPENLVQTTPDPKSLESKAETPLATTPAVSSNAEGSQTYADPKTPAVNIAPAEPPVVQKENKVKLFEIHGKKVDVEADKYYPTFMVRPILKEIHSDAFSDLAIKQLFDLYEKDGRISGEVLIKIIEGTNGLILVDSKTQQPKILSALRLQESELSEALTNEHLRSKYLHTLPGVIDKPYVLASELNDFRKEAEIYFKTKGLTAIVDAGGLFGNNSIRGSSPQRNNALLPLVTKPAAPEGKVLSPAENREIAMRLSKYHQDFSKRGIMPPHISYTGLLKLGILDKSSPEAIDQTYNQFTAIMGGWEFADLRDLATDLKMEWREFSRKYMGELVSRKLVKDISKMGRYDGPPFYVIAKGKRAEIRNVVETSPLNAEKI